VIVASTPFIQRTPTFSLSKESNTKQEKGKDGLKFYFGQTLYIKINKKLFYACKSIKN